MCDVGVVRVNVHLPPGRSGTKLLGRAATFSLRRMLQFRLAISPILSTLTPGETVPTLTSVVRQGSHQNAFFFFFFFFFLVTRMTRHGIEPLTSHTGGRRFTTGTPRTLCLCTNRLPTDTNRHVPNTRYCSPVDPQVQVGSIISGNEEKGHHGPLSRNTITHVRVSVLAPTVSMSATIKKNK